MLHQALRGDRNSLCQQRFGTLGGVAAQVAFANLGTHNHARPCGAEAFRGCLMSLQFVLTITLFSWHGYTPLRKFNGCEPTAAVGKTTKRLLYQII
jgi:hypothetical protein